MAPSTPVQDYRLHVKAFQHHFAAIFGLDALARLREPPDLLLCDGQGIAHPRRLGIASHLGLLVDIPAIGVAKTRLCGTHEEPPDLRGAWSPLRAEGEIIGAVLRMGQQAGLALPTLTTVYAAVLPQELRARGEVQFE